MRMKIVVILPCRQIGFIYRPFIVTFSTRSYNLTVPQFQIPETLIYIFISVVMFLYKTNGGTEKSVIEAT